MVPGRQISTRVSWTGIRMVEQGATTMTSATMTLAGPHASTRQRGPVTAGGYLEAEQARDSPTRVCGGVSGGVRLRCASAVHRAISHDYNRHWDMGDLGNISYLHAPRLYGHSIELAAGGFVL